MSEQSFTNESDLTPDLAVSMAGELDQEVTEPPADAPTLRPMGQLNRRLRAQFMKGIENIPVNADGEISMEMSGSMKGMSQFFGVLADIEDALRLIAIDPEAFDKWARSCSENDLMRLFFWAFKGMSLGEANASQTS